MGLLGFDELFDVADAQQPNVPVAAAGGDDPTVLQALAETTRRGWTRPILCGPASRIEAVAKEVDVSLSPFQIIDAEHPAQAAVDQVRQGNAELLMKGQIATPDLMRAVLSSENGLRTGKTICQIVMMEITSEGRRFLLADTGITIQPDVRQASEIVQATSELARSLGCDQPRIAMMAATEKVTDAMPETHLAERVRDELRCPDGEPVSEVGIIQGPLSFDLAYSMSAGAKKGFSGEAVGAADAMVFPNLLSANLTVKAIMYTAECRFGGILAGVACPVVFMSRADDTPTRIRSLSLAISRLASR